MADFITATEAVKHLRLPAGMAGSPVDADLQGKMDAAEAAILDYLKFTPASPSDWTAMTVPLVVKAAILIQLGELWRFRGDDGKDSAPEQADGQLSTHVTNLLRRLRDPALA